MTMMNYTQPNSAWTPRIVSIGIHMTMIGVALIPWTSKLTLPPKLNETAVLLYTPPRAALTQPVLAPGRAGGGGGGGRHQPNPASLGQLPRQADLQIVPPDPEPPKNPDPKLIVEPTVVAPPIAELRPLALFNIGDPNGIVGPPSSGPGDGDGIGNGKGHGIGVGEGPGVGDGKNGGTGGGDRHAGGRVTGPTLIYRVDPEYSEEARKARYEGVVILEAVVRRDGMIDTIRLVRSLGFGLDQSAIEAVKKWRFRPGTKNGAAVDVPLRIEVSFNLR